MEIYFSASDLAAAHSDLLSHLRSQIDGPFEQSIYSFFGSDCFFHLCRVAAGLDSAILAETEIQRQVKIAYAHSKHLSSSLHYLFQKSLKISKEIRSKFHFGAPTLYSALWQLTEWRNRQILLVGHSMFNRGFISFLHHKKVCEIALCTRDASRVHIEGIQVMGREVLRNWQQYDVIVCAAKAEGYLIQGPGGDRQILFDLGVPRHVDPLVAARVYSIEEIQCSLQQKRSETLLRQCEALIWKSVMALSDRYHKRLSATLAI